MARAGAGYLRRRAVLQLAGCAAPQPAAVPRVGRGVAVPRCDQPECPWRDCCHERKQQQRCADSAKIDPLIELFRDRMRSVTERGAKNKRAGGIPGGAGRAIAIKIAAQGGDPGKAALMQPEHSAGRLFCQSPGQAGSACRFQRQCCRFTK